jgi:mono/diheme cytochrome c family protein
MNRIFKVNRWILIISLGLAGNALAVTPEQMLAQFQAEAGGTASVERGKRLYHNKFGGPKADSCAACHTDNPRDAGAHLRTHKRIDALAPAVNPERFTDREKVEKWFKRNCNEVLNRACTAQEKADFTAYVLSR